MDRRTRADTGRHGLPWRAKTYTPQNEWTGHYSSWRPPFLCSQPIVVKLESRWSAGPTVHDIWAIAETDSKCPAYRGRRLTLITVEAHPQDSGSGATSSAEGGRETPPPRKPGG
jgi:hypothetical protein